MHQDERVDLQNIYNEILDYSKNLGLHEFQHFSSPENIVEIFKKVVDENQRYKREIEESSLMLEKNLEEISSTYDLISTLLEITDILSKDVNPFKNASEIVNVLERNLMAKELSLFLLDDGSVLEFSNSSSKKAREFFESYRLTSKSAIMNDQIPLMVIPIKSGEEFSGAFVCIGKENGTFFSAADRKIVEAASKQLKVALSNYNYFRKEMKRVIIEKELAIAQEIQQKFFPQHFPANYKIYGASLPARNIGGDYYDAFERNNKLFVTIADVSGKGIGAAIMMSMFRSYLRSSSSRPDLHEVAMLLNHLMCEELSEDKFVTAVIGIFDPVKAVFEYVNAGHDPVFIIKNGNLKLLESDAPPFGITESDDFYVSKIIDFSPGDLLVMYTDGFPEARNENGQEYGLTNLSKRIVELSDKMPLEIVHTLFSDLKAFSKSSEQHDDMTILVLKG